MRVSATAPLGWVGPGHANRPSYDTWSFSRGEDPAACYLEVRLDPARNSSIRFGAASPADVVAYFKESLVHPEVEKIATISLDGSSVFVYAVHNAGGDERYITDVRRDETIINFSLLAPNRTQLEQFRPVFLDFLQSVKFDSTRRGLTGRCS